MGGPLNERKHPHITMLKEALMGDDGAMAIHITGDIPNASGLGSSAALSAAAGAAMHRCSGTDKPLDKDRPSALAHLAEASAQNGRASPMDASTSVEGGVVVLSDVREPIGDWLYTPPHHAGGGADMEVHSLSVPSDDVYLVLGEHGVTLLHPAKWRWWPKPWLPIHIA